MNTACIFRHGRASSRPSTSFFLKCSKDVDARHKAGHEETFEAALIARASLCLSIIICGLALRGFGFSLGLPPYFVKYGGSLLWGTMVFFIVAIAGSSLSRRSIALIAAAIVVCVEVFRLGS